MAPRKKVSQKEDEFKKDLLTALEFICLNAKDEGDIGRTNCVFLKDEVVAFDGFITIGHPVTNEMQVAPHTKLLLQAVKRAPRAFVLTQIGDKSVVLQAGAFRATIPAYPREMLPFEQPDAIAGPCNEALAVGLGVVHDFASETGLRIELASVLCRSGSVVATNGTVAMEYWHGITFPELVVPKAFAALIAKVPHKIVSFGFSESSLTLFFDNKGWIKTRLYQDKWPDINRIFNKPSNPVKIGDDFKEIVKSIQPFAENKVFITGEKITSSLIEAESTSYDFKFPQKGAFSTAKLLSILPYVDTIDLTQSVSLFYGKNIRGAICQIA